MSNRKQLTEQVNQLLPERRTTMPTVGGHSDPRHPPAGPPVDGLDEAIKASTQKGALSRLHLLDFVSEQQQREDAAVWFEGGKDYVERTAVIDELRRELFAQIPWTGGDLRARVGRISKLEILIDNWRAQLSQAEQTLKTERADAVRMADIHVTQLDLQVRQPATSESDRADLQRLADMPLQTWRARVAKVQKTKGQNERLRGTAAPVGAETAPVAGTASPVPEPPQTRTLPAPAPPGRRGRKR